MKTMKQIYVALTLALAVVASAAAPTTCRTQSALSPTNQPKR